MDQNTHALANSAGTPVIVGMQHEKKEDAKETLHNAKEKVTDGVSSLFGGSSSHNETADGPHSAAPSAHLAEPEAFEPDEPIEPIEPKYILSISDNVVEKISSLAARKVGGIVDMKGNVFSMIQETFGANVKSKGVTADVVENGDAHVELSIILEYGKSAVEVFEGLKKVISEDVAHMTGLRIAQLTVNVVDVMNEKEIAEKRRKEAENATAKGESDTAGASTM
ncbi:MAG: Asp23/Gls24 family envelope stress response protein [Eggerthellaceae bacterium]|nr:Asp23/Gls24 family envelope stress response protein [Eggerthellaceae bacterium]